MPRKKRKYTRKKKNNFFTYLKKYSKIWWIILAVHIILVNFMLIFSFWKTDEILIVFWDNKQKVEVLSAHLGNKINKSLEEYNSGKYEKILILWAKNPHGINEEELILKTIIDSGIWQGNIAYETSDYKDYSQKTQDFLQKYWAENITYLSEFHNAQKDFNNFSTFISSKNIHNKVIFSNPYDVFIGIFQNYFYWWQKKSNII